MTKVSISRIFIASDHRGFYMKADLLDYLKAQGFDVEDVGPFVKNDTDDYVDYAIEVGQRVSKTPGSRGILICKSGNGMEIVANKFKGVYAIQPHDTISAEASRNHNNSNVLVLGLDSANDQKSILDTWINAGFLGGRHERRFKKIVLLEEEGLLDYTTPKVVPVITETTIDTIMLQYETFSKFSKRINIDIIDGVYAPNTTPNLATILENLDQRVFLSLHLMKESIAEDLELLQSIKNNVYLVYLHIEKIIPEILDQEYEFEIGAVVTQKDDLEDYREILKRVRVVQVMTVNLGFQGGKFIPENLEIINRLRGMGFQGEIHIDGGIHKETLDQIMEYKPSVLNVGSEIAKSDDPEGAYFELRLSALGSPSFPLDEGDERGSSLGMERKDLMLQHIATLIRRDVLEMLIQAKSGHAAGPLSAADLFAFLYFEHLKHDPSKPDWAEREYFLVSNGHICPIWYSALARSGYFQIDELKALRKFGSRLQGHPWNIKTPGVFNSSGSLGHGQGQAVGLALGLKLDKKNNLVYCFTSDGEHQEGAVWEAIMSAAKYKLGNLCFIVDCNNVQIDGYVSDIMPLDDPVTKNNELGEKYKSFGWNTIEIDGHNFAEIRKGFQNFPHPGKPTVILANTIAGKGVSELEGQYKYHDWRGDDDLAKRGINELNLELQRLLYDIQSRDLRFQNFGW